MEELPYKVGCLVANRFFDEDIWGIYLGPVAAPPGETKHHRSWGQFLFGNKTVVKLTAAFIHKCDSCDGIQR